MQLEELRKKFSIKLVAGFVIIVIFFISVYSYIWWDKYASEILLNQNNSSGLNANHWKRSEKFKVSAWVPDWSTRQSVESLKLSGSVLTNASPVWYVAAENGDLKDITPKTATDFLSSSEKLGLEITPSVALFDYTILTKILQNPTSFQNHVDQLIMVGTKPGFDGLDIDYEQIQLSDKEKFFELLSMVAEGLHAKDKVLSVAVLPKWGDDVNYLGLRETRQVQDWARIAKIADEVRVMTYDYTGQGSPQIGPVGPLNWQEQVVQYGLTKMPASKLVLGVQLYGYEKFVEISDASKLGDFSERKLQFQADYNKNIGKNDSSRAYNYTQVTKALSENRGTGEEYQGEKIFYYSKTNDETGKLENRVLVYIDPEGVQKRIDLAKKYNLRGVAFWRLGSEKDLLQNLNIPK